MGMLCHLAKYVKDFLTYWNHRDKVFKILDNQRPLRQAFQNFEPTWPPVRHRFQNCEPSGTLARICFRFFDLLGPCNTLFRIWDYLKQIWSGCLTVLKNWFQACGPTGTLATTFFRMLDLVEPFSKVFSECSTYRDSCDKLFVSELWTYWDPCNKVFWFLDLVGHFATSFQTFGPAGTLATKLSGFWTFWDPCTTNFSAF